MIERLVKLHFREDTVAEFEGIFESGEPTISSWPGCVHVQAWRSITEAGVYFTYSRWIDEASLEDYRRSDFFRATWARTKVLFQAAPEAWSSIRLAGISPPALNHQRLLLDRYQIDIGPIHRAQFEWLLSKNYSDYFIIVDDNTDRHCWPIFEEVLKTVIEDGQYHLIKISAGEQFKNLDTTQDIWRHLFEQKAGRKACVLNLGGGVVGDMGGFAAATYKRGIDFVQVPTTLLSQVDASVGGKLGIDFFELKNSIGVFNDPQAVWIDPAFLKTLTARELRSGYAEVIKHALIADANQWADLRQINALAEVADWQEIILRSISIKHRIVSLDPKEADLRKSLNFGHTIGHALESYWLHTDQRLLHGEAIAAGMICEAWLSYKLLGLEEAVLDQISSYVLKIYGHQPVPESAFGALIETMRQDKKNEGAEINCSLLPGIGSCRVNVSVGEELLERSLRYYNLFYM
ncbi:MAG: 3-dehydroquinate synthase [Bacteroidota bacterium]